MFLGPDAAGPVLSNDRWLSGVLLFTRCGLISFCGGMAEVAGDELLTVYYCREYNRGYAVLSGLRNMPVIMRMHECNWRREW